MTTGFSVNRNSAVTPEMSLKMMSASPKSAAFSAPAGAGREQRVADLHEFRSAAAGRRMRPHDDLDAPAREPGQRVEEGGPTSGRDDVVGPVAVPSQVGA